jgi:hypothetical protein
MRPLLETQEKEEAKWMNVGKKAEQASVVSWPVFVMPSGATPILVIALVETVERMGPRVEFSSLAGRFRLEGSSALVAAAKVAQELGLVRIERTEVVLTSLGSGFVRASEGKIGIIRAGLSRMEPFRTALELLLSKKRSVSASEVAQRLGAMKEEDVRSLLIEWAISSGLLRYSGKTRQFELA